MTNPLLALADVAAGWRTSPLAPSVAWAARRAVLDWFATTLPGCALPPATLLVPAMAAERPVGSAFCYVDGRTSSPRHAALLNAVASHIVEFDDIFRDGGYHPGSSTIAAALAVAQHQGDDADRFHRAIIAGYEVGCRVSLAIQPSHYAYWHTTATVGTIGAAVASAMLLGCDAGRIGHAIALASSFAGGHQQNLQGAGMAKALHPGHAADAGLLAAYAAAAGVTGSQDALHAHKGFAAAVSDSAGNWRAALEGIGEWTPITRMTVKAHGCCGHIFPALDGIEALRQELRFAPEDVAAIHVEGYAATRDMCDRPQAVSAQDARFSIQYCLAAQLVLGAVRLGAFDTAALADPVIRSLMPLISVSVGEDLAAAYPRKRQARLIVRLKDGREFRHFQAVRKGDPEAPLNDAELMAKFEELAGSVADAESVRDFGRMIMESDGLPGPFALMRAAG